MSESITLSKPLQQFVTEQAEARGLKNNKAYLTQLLKEEQLRIAKQRLIEKIEEGRASGYHEVTAETWKELRERVKAKFASRKKAKAR